jgi:cytoskeleton protein RodZ
VLAIGGVVVVILAALWLIGHFPGGGNGKNNTQANTPTTTTPPAATTKRKKPAAATPALASLRLVPTGPVYVCLIDDKGNKRIPGQTITPTTPQRTYHAKRFLMTVGNAQLSMRVNGKTLAVPPSTGATNYVITPTGRHTRPAGQGPNCG